MDTIAQAPEFSELAPDTLDSLPKDLPPILSRAEEEGWAPTHSGVDEEEDARSPDLSPAVRLARWQEKRPRIDHLPVGVVETDGIRLPVFDLGDRIVADRRTDFLDGTPWLDTLVGQVVSIDDDTGVVVLLDEESDPRCPIKRFVSFMNPLQELRLAPAYGNPFNAGLFKAQQKEEARKKAAAELKALGLEAPPKRGRGRPPGSKNRPKDIIQAEKEAYRKSLEEKRAARKARRM